MEPQLLDVREQAWTSRNLSQNADGFVQFSVTHQVDELERVLERLGAGRASDDFEVSQAETNMSPRRIDHADRELHGAGGTVQHPPGASV